jgi:N-acetylglucosaminyl-diphospho-decaprenol L-rhamnosyltransferase
MTLPNRTAVVVSAHRPYPTIDACLQGFQSIVERKEDLIFVNNGSSAPLMRLVSEKFPEITMINLSRNGLFCAGYNAGIRAALDKNYDFVLIANADTEIVNPLFISELLEAAGRWPKAAFLGPMVFFRNRESIQNTRLQFPSIFQNLLYWIPWRLFPDLFNGNRLKEGKVGFLNGVCVLCRVAALREFGLMDEQYGGYVEDADWSWRARESGWSSVFVPVPSIIHHEEHEGYEYFSFKSFLLKRNTVLWFLKAGRRLSALAYALASIGLAWIRIMSAQNSSIRGKHQQFLRDLSRCYRRMIFSSGLDLPKPSEEWDLQIQ